MTPDRDRVSLLLSSYLDGELASGELDEVVFVLETDLDAVAEFRHLQAVRRAVRTLPSLNPPLSILPGGHLGEELSAYLDGELTTGEMPTVSAHLDTCAECRAELADLDRSRIAVRALPGVEPPAFLAVQKAVIDRKRRRWVPATMIGGAAAMALVFAMSSGGAGDDSVAVDITDLQSRHAAVASVPSAVTGVEVAGP